MQIYVKLLENRLYITVNQHFGANLKKHVFCKILLQISCFFSTKNAENGYFDQRLECAAPKCWSKYTTVTRRRTKALCKFFRLHLNANILIEYLYPFLISPGVNNSNLRVWQNTSLASRLVKTSPQTRNP